MLLLKIILHAKGVCIPLDYPLCSSGVDEMIHVFFACPFALARWSHAGMCFDMSAEDFALNWLLSKLQVAPSFELLTIAKVLWGIWFFFNKKI